MDEPSLFRLANRRLGGTTGNDASPAHRDTDTWPAVDLQPVMSLMQQRIRAEESILKRYSVGQGFA
jgi:hypothetical protein